MIGMKAVARASAMDSPRHGADRSRAMAARTAAGSGSCSERRSIRCNASARTNARATDGGGRWRVYGTRVAGDGDGQVATVLGCRLTEGLETRGQD